MALKLKLPTNEGSARKRSALAVVLAAAVPATLALRRRGYPFGGDVIVRCRQGHLFTTIWVPLASLKAVRLGWWRFQRCPVGGHWSLVSPVRESELTEEERLAAKAAKDIRIP
jgi:hypothetical protein